MYTLTTRNIENNDKNKINMFTIKSSLMSLSYYDIFGVPLESYK